MQALRTSALVVIAIALVVIAIDVCFIVYRTVSGDQAARRFLEDGKQLPTTGGQRY
jgi:hypothetical protein